MATDSQPTLGQDTLRVIRAEAAQIAEAVIKAARSSRGNEAQLAMQCDLIFADFAKARGSHWEPLGERQCFFISDSGIPRLVFGLTDDGFQVLYHFTMGGPVDDPRLQMHPPYQHLGRAHGCEVPRE